MNSKLLIFLLIFPIAVNGWDRFYEKSATPSADEEKVIIKIAEEYGLIEIESIKTANLHPGRNYIITVKEKETITGRLVSYRTLNVKSKRWYASRSGPRPNDFILGDMWASEPTQVQRSILKIDDAEYRCELISISIRKSESLLNNLINGEYDLSDSIRMESFKRIDFNRPSYFRFDAEQELYEVGFKSNFDPHEFFVIKVKSNIGSEEIVSLSHMIS